MATGLGSAGANTSLDALVAAYPWVKLHLGDPGAAGTSNPATETARKQATFSAASGGAITNSVAIAWPSYPATEDPTHFSLWSASSGGNFGASGTISAGGITSGQTYECAAGDLDLNLTLAS